MKKMSSSAYFKSSGLDPIAQVVDAESQSGATLFRLSDDSHPTTSDGKQKQKRHRLIIACRGSANVRNFGTNLQFKLVPAIQLSQTNIPQNALVHEGFQMASAGLWKQIYQPLKEYLDSTPLYSTNSTAMTKTEIIYTGHSLGAATALLCATHHQASFCTTVVVSSIITFGGPRLCNSVLARYIRNEALYNCLILHSIHTKDPILTNNQQLWNTLGYENVGIELECDPYHPRVYTTIEKEKSDAALLMTNPFNNVAWNIVDHCYYMGVYIGPRLVL
jgi:hypothetical protein